MIYLKMILACILSAIPFLYVSFIKPRKDKSPVWRNMFTVIGRCLPPLTTVKNAMNIFLIKMYIGMKFSDNFRKFFTLIVLIIMIGIQYTDFCVSSEVAKTITEIKATNVEGLKENSYGISHIFTLESWVTTPQASLLAAVMALSLFSYRMSDYILTQLHNSNKLFFFTAIATLVVLFVSLRYLIIVETILLFLTAAEIYPNKITDENPKGKKRLNSEKIQPFYFNKTASLL